MRATHGEERSRLAWAALPLCALFVEQSIAGVAAQAMPGASGTHNLALNASIAVAVYFVARLLRHRTDALVTNFLFPRSERRLRAFRELSVAIDQFAEDARLERDRR